MSDFPGTHGITKKQVDAQRSKSFIKEAQQSVTDDQVVGLMVSRYFDWDIYKILRVCYAALEDASGHRENEKLVKMFPKAFAGVVIEPDLR